MPATERRFSHVPPARLYLDSDILLNYLIGTQPHHARCRGFLQRLATTGLTRIYVSTLTWLEIAHVVTREDFRQRLSSAEQQSFSLARWADEPIRDAYVRAMLGRFERLLDQFEWSEIFVTDEVRAAMIPLLVMYRLSSQDACHLACAFRGGVVDLASFDEAYRRVDGLFLWNDLLHGTT